MILNDSLMKFFLILSYHAALHIYYNTHKSVVITILKFSLRMLEIKENANTRCCPIDNQYTTAA